MSDKPKYKRVLLKVSGEFLCSPGGAGIDTEASASLVEQLMPLIRTGIQIGLVVGGGNLIRGRELARDGGIRQATADQMGMLATIINALTLRDAIVAGGAKACVLSAIEMTSVCEPFTRRGALSHMESGEVVILAGGTGNPFFTTDTCAALRACELDAEILLKATKVDGVFDSDPMIDPSAKRYERLTYEKVLADRLGVMDLAAISLCMTSGIPILVFQLTKEDNLMGAVCGKDVGTLITD